MIRSNGLFVRGAGAFAFCLALGLANLASASILGGILASGPNGLGLGEGFTINTINDNNIEEWVPNPNGQDSGTLVEVGDVFNLFLKFVSITSNDNPLTYGGIDLVDVVSPNYQLTAIGAFTVASIFDNGDGTGRFDFDGEVLVYESANPTNPLVDFSNDPTVTRQYIEETTQIATFAKVAVNGDFITGVLPLDLGNLPVFGDPAKATTVFGMTMTSGDLPLTREAPAFGQTFDLTGSTDVWTPSQQQSDNGWFAQSNTQVSVAAVPEPGSLAIMGLFACIFGCVAVRRNSRK